MVCHQTIAWSDRSRYPERASNRCGTAGGHYSESGCICTHRPSMLRRADRELYQKTSTALSDLILAESRTALARRSY
jgi:hypothetical protein